MKQSVKRLIDWISPDHYDLHITQNSDTLEFSGSVNISGTLTERALEESVAYLHTSDLTITSLKVNGNDTPYSIDEKAQELTLQLGGQITSELAIEVSFSGTITKPMHGLYPCFFTHEGKEKRLLATQFESHHAREVFPCIDEPEAKATFQLHLTTDASDVVLSNTPIEKTSSSKGLQTTTFEKTPRMSTYLLAWISGELIYEEATSKHGVQVRTYATPVHAGKLGFSVQVLCDAMDYLDDYFAIPYPLPKFDQIALPDFAAGAMENWGCVTFRESALLYDPEHSDLTDKQYVAEVVIHELAHQWFGNLVTMRWWNDLWLNEGFASWVPYLVRHELFPEWNVWEHFATGDLAIGLRADALVNTHPIVVDIHSPEEIRSAFDSISYDKGCSVINLLYHYIGADAFRDGLRTYLKKHSYANAETFDLWSAWDESSGKDVTGFMKTWTEESGFPIIEAKNDDKGLLLTQSRFYMDPEADRDTTLWPIPLMRGSDDMVVLKEKSMVVPELTKLNLGQSGFYRTIYKDEVREKLVQQLASGELDTVDALGLIADSAESSKAGYGSATDTMVLVDSIRSSSSDQLIGTGLGELAEMRTILSDIFDLQKPFVGHFIAPNLERLGIEPRDTDTIDDELLRPSILGAASYAGDEQVIRWALESFDSATTPEDLRPDVRGIVYQTAVRERGDIDTHTKLLGWYDANTIPGERTSLAVALASFKDPALAQLSLDQIMTYRVKLQDSLYWIAYGLRNRWNKDLAWTWVQQNWGWVAKNFGKEKEIDYYLRFCAGGFASAEHLKQYTDFFSGVDIYGSKRAFEQGKETIRWQSAWKKRDTAPVTEWLKNFTK
jgi:aminopeptidase N